MLERLYQLKNERAAKHLLDEIDTIYDRRNYNQNNWSFTQTTWTINKKALS